MARATGRAILLAGVLAVAACAVSRERTGPADAGAACTPPGAGTGNEGYCGFPAGIRAFLDDRGLCDHFRGEPWPEGDSAEDRARRQEIVEGVRTACARTDRRLDALKHRYGNDPAVMRVLSGYETGIESGAE